MLPLDSGALAEGEPAHSCLPHVDSASPSDAEPGNHRRELLVSVPTAGSTCYSATVDPDPPAIPGRQDGSSLTRPVEATPPKPVRLRHSVDQQVT